MQCNAASRSCCGWDATHCLYGRRKEYWVFRKNTIEYTTCNGRKIVVMKASLILSCNCESGIRETQLGRQNQKANSKKFSFLQHSTLFVCFCGPVSQSAKMPDFPPPIDPSYVPSISLQKVPATAPIEDMIAVLKRDGALILTDLISNQDIAAVNDEVEPYIQRAKAESHAAYDLAPKQTVMVPGVVGKSPTMAKIAEFDVIDALRRLTLQKKCTATWEDKTEEFTIGPLLNSSLTYHISYGGPRQRLHRDDMIHGIYHTGEYSLSNETMLGFMIAGSKTTRKNGATMAIPGSHKWNHTRVPKINEVCFAGESTLLVLSFRKDPELGIISTGEIRF